MHAFGPIQAKIQDLSAPNPRSTKMLSLGKPGELGAVNLSFSLSAINLAPADFKIS